MKLATAANADFPRQIRYPESDGEPIGETDFHIGAILYLRTALRWLFRALGNVYVAADMLFYYEEGNTASSVAPDVFVVKGIPTHDRRIYKLWEEKLPPCLVVEVTSRSSRMDDLGIKRGLYEMMGVLEYVVFDPLGEYLVPRLRVFELVEGAYKPADLDADGSYRSRVLPVIFRPEGALLRVVNPADGEPVPLLEEATDQALSATQRADVEARRADEEARRADEEARRAIGEARRADEEAQRADGEARRADEEAQRADEEARRAGEERRRAEAEKQKAASLEGELRRYRARFGDLGE